MGLTCGEASRVLVLLIAIRRILFKPLVDGVNSPKGQSADAGDSI
tara:strand:+ start:206 stop:340 length:135 start_codon:yes stop_codon:yes gene_type:complete